ncbi:MAG: CHASE2 domain-containing protein [Fibrobacteres bacterium]|nr:CHASE2 domain-containing protein [Fibrobacterota bacterium]
MISLSKARLLLGGFAGLVLLFIAIRPVRSLNRGWQDLLSRRAPSLSSTGKVVVVAIDDEIISKMGPWPWDRASTSALFRTVADLDPKVIGFDGYFPRRQMGSPGDTAFVRTLQDLGRTGRKVILPFQLVGDAEIDTFPADALPPYLATSTFQLLQDKPGLERSAIPGALRVVHSDSMYQIHSAPAGFINNMSDQEDGICRSMIHVMRFGDEFIPSFAIALVAAYGDATLGDVSVEPQRIQILRNEIPIDENGAVYIRYMGSSPAVPTIPAGDLMENPAKYASQVAGKIVIIGVTSTSGLNPEAGDFIRTPLIPRYPGVELWAVVVDNILANRVPRTTTTMRLWELCLAVFLAGGSWAYFRRFGSDGRFWGIATASVFAVLLLQVIIDRAASVQSGVDLPLLGLVFAVAGVRLFRQDPLVSPPTMLSPATIAGQATAAISTRRLGIADPALPDPDGILRIGRFEIVGELGRGAMGVVQKGYDRALERHVAIKVLSAVRRLGEHMDENLSRFQREARAIAQLNHPSIVTIFEYGEWQGSSFIAMELLDGPSLDKLLQEHRLPWKAVRAWGLQLLEALSYAHVRGVVHRDIKPANVMAVDQGRRVKLTDFGLALHSDSSLTQEGQILGTPYYMAPELIDGKKGDAHSDQYALGVLFYEMISRRRPFEGEEVRQIMLQILMHPPAPLGAIAGHDVPHEAVLCVERLMAKQAADRFADLDAAIEVWKRLPA